jgi:hypothetical protein
MTPEEKATELFKQYYSYLKANLMNDEEAWADAKQCALIAVDEVQQLIKDLSSCKNRFIYIVDEMNYWNEVKQEIEKL